MLTRLVCVILASSLLLATLCPLTTAQQDSRQGDALSFVPTNSLLFFHVDGKSLWNSSLFDEVQKRVPPAKWKKFEKAIFTEFEAMTGISRANCRSITLIIDKWDVPQVPGMAMILTTSTPIDRVKLSTAIRNFAKTKLRDDPEHLDSKPIQLGDTEYFPAGNLPGVNLYAGLLQANTAIMGDIDTIKKAIDQKKTGAKDGLLAPAISAARGKDVAFGMQMPESIRDQLNALLQMGAGARGGSGAQLAQMKLGMEIIKSMLEMQRMHVALDLKKDINLQISIEATDEKAAVRFQRYLDFAALAGDFGLVYLTGLVETGDAKDMQEFKKFFTLLSEACASSKVRVAKTNVDFVLNAPNAGPVLMTAAGSVVSKLVLLSDGAERQSNLRQIAIAMHNYHNDYNRLPSPATFKGGVALLQPGKNDASKPYLSWRVALLPYLEHDHVFRQFNMNEPWDSEHNKKLIPLMPKCYKVPGAPDPGEGKTYLQVFSSPSRPAGKQTFAPMFEMGRGFTLGQITVQDGTSNTIMVAESANAVIWTKPEDMLLENDETPLPALGPVLDEDTFYVVFADASVRSILRTLPNKNEHEKLLRQMIGRRDGLNNNVAPILK
jgi:hypothetical protein